MLEIHRTDKRKGNYTQIDNDLLFNPNLDAKAKILLIQIICMQPHWTLSVPYLEKINLDGKTSIRSGLTELKSKGYLEFRRIRDDAGKYVRTDHIVYEHLDLVHPHADIRNVDYPDVVDHPTNNNKNNKKNNNKNNTDVFTDPNLLHNHAQMIYDRYPDHRCGTFEQIVTALQRSNISQDDYPQMLQQLDLWIESNDWKTDNGTYVMGAAKWITTGRWMDSPRKPRTPDRRDLDPDELWAIQQMMAED